MRIGVLLSLLLLLTIVAHAQSTSFTYQGKLTDGGNPASGSYDLQFSLFNSSSGGAQIGSTLTRSSTAVAGGVFTVQLDFGVSAFPGANRFLEIAVRPAGVGSFTLLAPRQQISSTPYAIRTLSAATADTATDSTQLGGVAASQYVQTIDSRLSDSRSPTPGSSNYIQNAGSAQSANFNITGNGTVGNLFANNKVGVGTNSPAQSFQVNGISSFGPPGSVYSYFVPGASPGAFPTIGFNTYGSSHQAGVAGFGGIFQFQNGDGKLIYYTGSTVAIDAPHVNTPRVTIDKAGNVGIGTTEPSARLNVQNNSSGNCNIVEASWGPPVPACGNVLAVRSDGSAANLIHGFGAFGTVMQVRSDGSVVTNGSVGVGTLSPARAFHVNGRARVGLIPLDLSTASVCFNGAGDLLQCGLSSLKLKTNIASFRSGLDIVRRLKPISFDWKDGSGYDIGLGAEDVAKVAPSLTFTNNAGEVAGVKYERLNMLLINAIKEQQQQIERLKARLQRLEKRAPRRDGLKRRKR